MPRPAPLHLDADQGARLRHKARRDRVWPGWAGAALLHGGLLAALMFGWPPLSPALNPPAIALVLLPADNPARPDWVRARPPASLTKTPATATLKIANRPPHSTLATAVPKPTARSAPSPAQTPPPRPGPRIGAARGGVETDGVPQDDDGFAAAQPIAGDVNQPPVYPAEAQAHGEQGNVLLSIHVLTNGEADSVSVTQSSGYAILDAAAAAAVWKWRFVPSSLSGRPVPSVIPYRIHFSLQTAQGAD
jgi:protein TonB